MIATLIVHSCERNFKIHFRYVFKICYLFDQPYVFHPLSLSIFSLPLSEHIIYLVPAGFGRDHGYMYDVLSNR